MDNIMPTVSVIMNCLNCSKYLKEAIDSVFAQTYQDWEIIFFDDNSSDNSLEIAKSYGKNVKCFRSDQTYSLGQARNLAIEKSSGKYLAFLDCDDKWLPAKLQKQVNEFEKDESVGIVCSNAFLFNKNGEDFPHPDYLKTIPPQGLVFGELLKNYFLCLPTVAIRKEVLLSIGEWFDKRFSQIEEVDVFLRIAKNWKVAYIPEVLAKYRIHRDSWTYTHMSKSPEEKELLIEKFSKLYPNFKEDYKDEVAALQNQISYKRFYDLWSKGQAKKARAYFKPYLKFNKKLLPYIFSYVMPSSIFYSLVRIAIKIRLINKPAEFR